MLLNLLGVIFLGLCLVAALTDIHSLKIPNWLNLTLAGLFVPAAILAVTVHNVPLEVIGGHLMLGALAFLIAFGLFAFNVFGGGDAKMIPAVMLWMGPSAGLDFVMCMAIMGGVFAFGILMVRKSVPAAILPGAIRAPFEDGAGVPYGVAITAGVFMAAASSPLLTNLLSIFSDLN
jgi:prepilin peptidase CpaA